MIFLVYYLKNSLFFGVPLLNYYINLRSSICLSFFWRYICFFWYFSMKSYIFYSTASYLFCGEVLKAFVTLLAPSWTIKLPFAFYVFRIALFEAVCICSDFRKFFSMIWLYLLLTFLLIFLPIFFLLFLAKVKYPWPLYVAL